MHSASCFWSGSIWLATSGRPLRHPFCLASRPMREHRSLPPSWRIDARDHEHSDSIKARHAPACARCLAKHQRPRFTALANFVRKATIFVQLRLHSCGERISYRHAAGFASRYALVAQLDRALDYESRGREFESLRAHHFFKSRMPVDIRRVFNFSQYKSVRIH